MSCPNCAEPIGPTDRFCEACGTDLVVRASTSTAAGADTERTCRACGTVAGPADGEYCPDCGLRHRDRTDRIEIDLGDLAGVSDRGLVHARNEDAMAIGRRLTAAKAAVVCDGVSTSRSPELASSTAADIALEVLLAPRADGQTRTRDAIAAAGRVVAGLDDHPTGPSCTLVSALVEPLAAENGQGGVEITVGWVGDSRAYWLAEPGAAHPSAALTSDHSWVVEMVAAGLVDPAVAAKDRRAHAITRWLGPEVTPAPEVVTLRPAGSGALLLCSDGLWNNLPDPADLSAVALPEAYTSPLAAAAALTAVALEAGGRDNITVVIIPVSVRSRP